MGAMMPYPCLSQHLLAKSAWPVFILPIVRSVTALFVPAIANECVLVRNAINGLPALTMKAPNCGGTGIVCEKPALDKYDFTMLYANVAPGETVIIAISRMLNHAFFESKVSIVLQKLRLRVVARMPELFSKTAFTVPMTLRAPARFWRVTAISSLLLSAVLSFAGYTVQTDFQTGPGTNSYAWTVYNQDQTWGLDMFGIEVPLQTVVLSYTVPPPYANPDGTAYWIFQQTTSATIDPHDNSVTVPASQPGKKWLLWRGQQSPSVYPPGTTATFRIKTTSSVRPGFVRETAVTYTPQYNPHYYLPWPAAATGPGVVELNARAEHDVS